MQRREISWEREDKGSQEGGEVEGGGKKAMMGGGGGGGGGGGMREAGRGGGGGGGGREKREGGGGGGGMHKGEIEGERGSEEAMEGVREMGQHQDIAYNSVDSCGREGEKHEDPGATTQTPHPPTKPSSTVG